MKQGTGRTVLVTELLRNDGPYQDAAADFVSGTCSLCGMTVADQDARFHDVGYLCFDCWQLAAGLAG